MTRVVSIEPFERGKLLRALRDGVPAYAQARLALQPADPDALMPAQRYVLMPGVERILALRAALLAFGVDIFALDGGVWVETENGRLPVIPPIVEDRLIADGIHRVYAARSVGVPITVVTVRGASQPYYAYPLAVGWAGVRELDRLPERFAKKTYREDRDALYRDYNAVFPGVQATRGR